MAEIRVHPRVHERHPEIADEDAAVAWMNAIAIGKRSDEAANLYVAVGFDARGRLLEVLTTGDGRWNQFNLPLHEGHEEDTF